MSDFAKTYADNQAWIFEQRRIEARRKLAEGENRAMSTALMMAASSMMPTALLDPDPRVAGRAFARSHKYTMVAALIGSGLVPADKMDKALELLEDDDERG